MTLMLAPAPELTATEQAAALALYCSPRHMFEGLTREQVVDAVNEVLSARSLADCQAQVAFDYGDEQSGEPVMGHGAADRMAWALRHVRTAGIGGAS